MKIDIAQMDVVASSPEAIPPALDVSDSMIWRNYAGIHLKGGTLFLNANGSRPGNARLFLVATGDDAYEVQVEVTVPSGGIGGLILFYNDKAFIGLTSDGAGFTLYRNAATATRKPSGFGGHFFLKIVNWRNRCTFFAGDDGRTWMSLMADVDVSGLQHNSFWGFLTLRLGLMAAGSGEVKFDHYTYKKL